MSRLQTPYHASDDQFYLEAELQQLVASDNGIWRFIQQGSLDGIWYWNLERPSEEWMSPEFWELFGIDPATKAHDPAEWMDLIHPEDLKTATANFEAHCADPNHPYDQIVRFRHADGSTVWVRCRGIAIRDDTGRPMRMLGAHNDITEVKEAELLAKARAEELEIAHRELEEKAALALENTRLKAFAYGLSHDLRAPARNSEYLLAELLGSFETTLPDDTVELLEHLVLNNQRMLRLTGDVMRYARAVESSLKFEPVDLNALLEDILAEMTAQIEQFEATVTFGDLPTLPADRTQLWSLFQNLIDNSLKYRLKGRPPRIRISAHLVEGLAVLHVSDNGPGIPGPQRNHVFRLFRRLHREADIDGTGLGLAICKEIAGNHGGYINIIETPEGEGTTFEIGLAR